MSRQQSWGGKPAAGKCRFLSARFLRPRSRPAEIDECGSFPVQGRSLAIPGRTVHPDVLPIGRRGRRAPRADRLSCGGHAAALQWLRVTMAAPHPVAIQRVLRLGSWWRCLRCPPGFWRRTGRSVLVAGGGGGPTAKGGSGGAGGGKVGEAGGNSGSGSYESFGGGGCTQRAGGAGGAGPTGSCPAAPVRRVCSVWVGKAARAASIRKTVVVVAEAATMVAVVAAVLVADMRAAAVLATVAAVAGVPPTSKSERPMSAISGERRLGVTARS